MQHRVMVVEDDDDIRESLVDILADEGYVAIGACHGRDALDKLVSSPERPCLIVLDLMMPVMDGAGFREVQLQDPGLSQIPVIVISACRDLDEGTRGMQPAAMLKKPLKVKDLLDVVHAQCPLR
jgi:DNA-binding response OmpR family regulator